MSQSRGDSSERAKWWRKGDGQMQRGKIKAKLKATRRDDRGVDVEKHQDAWRENSC